jgi:GNAT superfamily N-acetyltransferase/chorismate mutase
MPTEDLSLRRADESDAETVASIHLSSRREAAMPPAIHTEEEVRHWLGGRLRTDEVWLATIDDRPAGYARVTSSWLDDLYVAPAYAGHGVGSALLELVKAQHPDGFCLWVFEMNLPARRFYAHRGLVDLEHTDGSGNEEREPDVKMAWPGADAVAFFRGLIDEVDVQLGDLLARRAALTKATQAHKPDPSRDPAREREIAEAMARRAPGLGAERLSRIVHTIITESLEAAADEPTSDAGRDLRSPQ